MKIQNIYGITYSEDLKILTCSIVLISIWSSHTHQYQFDYLACSIVYSGKYSTMSWPCIPFYTWLRCTVPCLSCNTAEAECRTIHTAASNWSSTTVESRPYKVLRCSCYKNLAIANRSRDSCAQYAEGIYRHKYYTVTLKSRLRVTQGHWKRNHWTDHTRLSSSRVIWRWILLWPWNVG